MKRNLMVGVRAVKVAVLAAGASLAFVMPAHAEGMVEILGRLARLGPAATTAITAISYAVGAALGFYALSNIRALGNARNEPGKGGAVLAALVAAVGLIYMPYAIQSSAETVFGEGANSAGSSGSDRIDRR
jgi:hypothetical protein